MKKRRGLVIVLSLFIVIILSLIGIYFVGITQLGTGSAIFYYENVFVNFAKESTINIGYSTLLQEIRMNGLFLPYSNNVLFHGEDMNANGKLDENEDIVNNNGFIDTVFPGNINIYARISPSIPLKEGVIAGIKVRPSYVIKQDNISVIVFLKIIDASSKFNIKNSSRQIVKNIADYLQINGGYEFLLSVSEEVRKDEYGWLNRFKDKYMEIYDFFTIYSYVDKKVVKNTDYSDLHKKNIYSVLEMYPKVIEFESFSPVNINTINYDVLYNLLNGLKGYYFKSNSPQTDDFPMIDNFHNRKQSQENTYIGTLEVVEINDTLARKLAESILNFRRIEGVIKSFSDIDNYLKKHNFDKNVIDLLMANFNSSLYSYKYNVPYFDDKVVDRFQLINPTTTISLFPTGMFEFYYDIFVVNNKTSKIMYDFTDYSIIKLYDIDRYTLSTDFNDIQISKTDKTLNGFALDIYPVSISSPSGIDAFDSYLGSGVTKIYDENELKDNVSFYIDFVGRNIKPKVAEGSNVVKLSSKSFPKEGRLSGYNLSELGNVFYDGVYFDNFSSISVPVKKNFPPPIKLGLYEILMKIYKSSLLAELYNLAQAYPTSIKTIQTCISFFVKPNRFLGFYRKPRVLFHIFSPITKDYYSYIYFFGFLYPNLQSSAIKPKVFVIDKGGEGKELFFNFGDTGGLSHLYGIKNDLNVTILDGLWHNVAFCISNTNFRDIKKQIDELGEFNVELFRTKDWLYGPMYYKKILDILNVDTKYVKIYIDGDEVGENITFSSGFKNLVSDFFNVWRSEEFGIGVSMDNPVWNYPLDSSLSHFTIWGKILSPEEVKKFLAVDKYYVGEFSLILKNSNVSALYFEVYSKDNVNVYSSNFRSLSYSNSKVLIRNGYDNNINRPLILNFYREGNSKNNFVMLDNITLFHIVPLLVVK